jgi:hypothetical protein
VTTILSQIKTFGAAAIIATTLGATAITATPAFAQDAPPSGFSLQVPQGGGNQMEQGQGQGQVDTFGQGRYDPDSDDFYYCLDNGEIRRGLQSYGFRRVRITREFRNDVVEAVAYWGRTQYSMRVDRCTGEVYRIRQIRRGFGLQFNFGG